MKIFQIWYRSSRCALFFPPFFQFHKRKVISLKKIINCFLFFAFNEKRGGSFSDGETLPFFCYIINCLLALGLTSDFPQGVPALRLLGIFLLYIRQKSLIRTYPPLYNFDPKGCNFIFICIGISFSEETTYLVLKKVLQMKLLDWFYFPNESMKYSLQ